MRRFEGRDRDICRMLGTNASELEKLLGKSRQTISKHIERDQFFGISEVIEVAEKKYPDAQQRAQIVSQTINKHFPEIVQYTRDLDPQRFSQYYIFGMDIYAELISNEPLERFLVGLLNNPDKFLLFACAPAKPYFQLGNWIKGLQAEGAEGNFASLVLVPCTLVELTPLQILADPWSNQPQLVQYDRQAVFVDLANANRAQQIASGLREYGPAARELPGMMREEDDQAQKAADKLKMQLNRSVFHEVMLPEAVVSASPRR